ncbi:MAG: hypothetical protein LUF30_07325, partial [Lachnospiraceae bacterium]|nr:hypothetical protein [Lachnospiraceae bacterium]
MKHWKLRLVLVILLIIVAVIFFSRGVVGLLGSNSGWQTISASSSEYTCANEFTFQYNIGTGSAAATTESNAITSLYSE